MNHHRPAAVLWDMDGTLIDSEPYWMTAEGELVREFGGDWSHDDGLDLVGRGLWDSAAILQAHGVAMDADEIVARLTRRVTEQLTDLGTPWRPGARELLAEVRAAGIPTALVTMSMRAMAQQVVEGIGFDAFDALVTGDDVVNPKPHPEPYLRGIELLEVAPGRSIAIEDSVPGVRSAVAAGLIVVAVPFIADVPESDDHTTWSTLADRDLSDLRTLAAAVTQS